MLVGFHTHVHSQWCSVRVTGTWLGHAWGEDAAGAVLELGRAEGGPSTGQQRGCVLGLWFTTRSYSSCLPWHKHHNPRLTVSWARQQFEFPSSKAVDSSILNSYSSICKLETHLIFKLCFPVESRDAGERPPWQDPHLQQQCAHTVVAISSCPLQVDLTFIFKWQHLKGI